MAITIKSYNEFLGDMVRKIIANTPLNDIHTGSALFTLLEAAASNDFENNVAILNVLELMNIDNLRDNDLDTRAADFGLTRNPAVRATGFITIFNSNIVKQSTGLYPVKPAPISGSTVLYVNNASGWSNTGTLFIGRGTASFEGPIGYTSITNYNTYYAIQLNSALQKDHLSSDSVINSQGTVDQLIPAGTVAKIPANNEIPEVQYAILRDTTLAAGEDSVSDISVVALTAGSIGNAGINTIVSFNSPPFSGATVTNTTAFTSGSDIEGDLSLRERIKAYAQSLARGTKDAIVNAVINVSDPDDNKQVASAVITEPVAVTDPSILYIDDGTGFQPSYAGQSVDVLIDTATGKEEFLQLANFPLPRPQAVNTEVEPYSLIDGSSLKVSVDGVEETVYFENKNFVNITAATSAEIVIVINSTATLFSARLTNDSKNILLYPVAFDAEKLKVLEIDVGEDPDLYVNNILKFPTDEFSYISMYQNNERMWEKARAAFIETAPYGSWNISVGGDISIAVDNTPAQDRNFSLTDFAGASSFSSLALEDWVEVFNTKFAGLTATATSSQTMLITSNKIGSSSSIVIDGGSYLNQWFPNTILTSTGQTAEFQLNRETGNIRILNEINPGDRITAGIEDARGFAISASTISGTYNLSSDAVGRPAEMVVVLDSSYCTQKAVPLTIGLTISISDMGNSIMRVMSASAATFASLEPGNFLYISKKNVGWFSSANCGLYKLIAKGSHTNAGVDTYVDVLNNGIVTESMIVSDASDIKAFATDAYPQIWRGLYLSNPPAATIADVVESLNSDILGTSAAIYRSNSIKLTSASEINGSIAIPVAIGSTSLLFVETPTVQVNNPPQVASRISSKDLFSYFRRLGTPTAAWMNRSTYDDVKAAITADAIPDSPPSFSGTYSELIQATGTLNSTNVDLDDIVSFTRGNNKGQQRTVKALVAVDQVGTQEGTPRTEFDHVIGDEVQVVKSLEFAPDDNIVVVMDNNASVETIDIAMSRTGIVNSGSNSISYLPTTTQFSATDYDNEPGIDFSNLNTWGTVSNSTDFSDYALWMRARNWYSSGGVGAGNGAMLLRAAQYGPNGEKLRFSIGYPTTSTQANSVSLANTPSWSEYTYYFGSGAARSTSIISGTTISVKGPYPDVVTNFPNGAVSSGNYYDYTFSAGTLASVQVNDIISIGSLAGISAANRGQFGVKALNGNTIRVLNPNASSTSPGSAEVVHVTTIADILGTPTSYTINTVADVASSLSGEYFIVYDTIGSVAVWYDVGNVGTPEPPHGAHRSIKVATILPNDNAITVATKTYAYLILDSAFTAVAIGNQITVTNKLNGALGLALAGTSGFSVSTSIGTNNASLDGEYFIIYDAAGSVAIWFDVGNDGTPEPFHGANRSIRVGGINYGDNAANVAVAIMASINFDVQFTSSVIGNALTIINTTNGSVPAATAGTSGFAISSTTGSFGSAEIISNAALVSFFPLANTAVSDIVSKINADMIMVAVTIGVDSLTITSSTAEETYTYTGNSTALAFGHNPGNPLINSFVSLYDGGNWVKAFSNLNPNFVLKKPLTLNGIAPSIYKMDVAPNSDTTAVGELFKLIPTTIKNVHHHFTQKALSQLPIVADVDISNKFKNVQIKSKQLGSAGAVEVVGGRGNTAVSYIIGESEVVSDTSGNYLLVNTAAFPDTFNVGDTVLIQNDVGVKRYSRLSTNDTMDVGVPSTGIAEYKYNFKSINILNTTTFTISDVSSTYGMAPGIVWRWLHSAGVTLADVVPGDLVVAIGSFTGWSMGNMARSTGDGLISGLPIINVNDSAGWFDVVNPYGVAMPATTVGTGFVGVCPTPIVKWNLAHSARINVASASSNGTIVTIVASTAHFLHDGDNVSIKTLDNVPDGIYSSVTIVDPKTFTFAMVGPVFSEVPVGATILNANATVTRYRLESLGINNIMRLSRHDGDSPRFKDCGVAVDDYISISGTTFKANNDGLYRVLAVDNDSVIYINDQGASELNTIVPFNDKGTQVTWTSNFNLVTGIAGAFKNVAVGTWVKKEEDDDSRYVQVVSMNAAAAFATSITLGSNYEGSDSTSIGVSYDENISYDKGVYLAAVDDIIFYEGDSALVNDNLSIQNIVDPNWFSSANSGEFVVTEFGSEANTGRIFLRVNNLAAVADTNKYMSVNLDGVSIVESLDNKYSSYREVTHVSIDDTNEQLRSIYMSPADRSYKFTNSNNTSITHTGKLGYSTDITFGIDGYLYYTGLLRRVQRIVDGFEPDPTNFPGRKAVGGRIETLPPLPHRIELAITIITNEGVNLGDISNNIKSTIINYIGDLGVGEAVVLSEMISLIQPIQGVSAVTFTEPVPSTAQIAIAQNEKAIITPDDISIA